MNTNQQRKKGEVVKDAYSFIDYLRSHISGAVKGASASGFYARCACIEPEGLCRLSRKIKEKRGGPFSKSLGLTEPSSEFLVRRRPPLTLQINVMNLITPVPTYPKIYLFFWNLGCK